MQVMVLQELFGYLSDAAMLDDHQIIKPSHDRIGEDAAEFREDGPEHRLSFQRILADSQGCLVGGKQA